MSFFDEVVLPFGSFALIIGLTIVGLVFGIQGCNLKVQPRVVVMVENKEVYRGSGACVSVKSLGANTQVTIGGGFMCAFPQNHYVSSNVKIENE